MPNEGGRGAINAQLAACAASASAQDFSLRRIYDTAPIGLAFLSPDCRYLQLNQKLTEICGIPVEGHLGRTVRECIPGLADAIEAIVRRIVETGEPVTGVEVAGQRPDRAEQQLWMTYWHPIHGPNDAIIGINVAAEEITERKRAEAALQASEQQLRTLADAIPQLVWMGGADGRIFWLNRQLADFCLMPADEIPGRDWLTALTPDTGRALWAECFALGAPFEMELHLRGKDGRDRPFLTRIVPLRDASGTPWRWIGTHIDISEQKHREEHIQFLLDELSHRSKNLLTVVTAIARQTVAHAEDVPGYYESFAERLSALAHAHDLLVKDHWNGAHFYHLVAAQLKPFGEIGQGRIAASGPPLLLRPKAVQYLGLALHELATNASKHGALSGARGTISIEWRMEGDLVRLRWRESGGPEVSKPKRRGFGQVVLERIVPRALEGKSIMDFAPDGLCWTFDLPACECESPPDA